MAAIGRLDENGLRLETCLAQGSQSVLHAGRLGREHLPCDQAVTFEIAEGLRQHSLGDVRDGALDGAEALRTVCQGNQARFEIERIRRIGGQLPTRHSANTSATPDPRR